MFRRSLLLLPLLTLPLGLLVAHFPSGAQAASNFQNVPAATANIHLALLFNYNLPNKTVETGKVDYVWGAQAKINTVATNNPAPTVAHTYYTMFTEANEAESLTWFQTNHPDWLVYKCDRTSIAMVGNQIPLDVTNPAVQSFELNAITQAMDGGYQGVGFDNTSTYNFFGKCGHYDTSGSWVQQFSGTHYDTAYRTATTTAFHQLTDQVRAAAAARNIPFYITINGGPNLWENQAAWYDLLPYLDFVVDEDGFTNGGYSTHNRLTSDATDTVGNAWLTKMQEFQYLQNTLGKGLVIAAQEPYQVSTGTAAPEGDVQWVLANYLMARSSHTYQALITGNQQYGGPVVMQNDYQVQIGDPTGDMYNAQGVYLRNYSNGLVIVNPSSTSAFTVTLPGSYQDVNGNPVGATVSVPATSGLILLNASAAVATSTPVPTSTVAATSTATSVPTSTPLPTSTPAATSTAVPTSTSVPASTALPTNTAVPTITSVPTNTSVPTSTSTPAGAGTLQVVANAGFESSLSSWSVPRSAASPVPTNSQVHSGSYSLKFCGLPGCNSYVDQAVSLPATVTHATLSYWVYVDAVTAGTCPDLFSAQINTGPRHATTTVFTRCTSATIGHWTLQTADVSSQLQQSAGQAIDLRFRGTTGAGSTTHFYLDDVRLDIL